MPLASRLTFLALSYLCLAQFECSAVPKLHEIDLFSRSFYASASRNNNENVFFYVVADTDEPARVGSNDYEYWIGIMDFDPGHGPGDGPENLVPMGYVTESPHSLYARDYAFAVAIFEAKLPVTQWPPVDPSDPYLSVSPWVWSEPVRMTSFLQVRPIGSSAAIAHEGANPYEPSDARSSLVQDVLDAGGLAQMAADAGLWPSADTYFGLKLTSSRIVARYDVPQPTEPLHYRQYALPEPGSLVLTISAGAIGLLRRSRFFGA